MCNITISESYLTVGVEKWRKGPQTEAKFFEFPQSSVLGPNSEEREQVFLELYLNLSVSFAKHN